MFNATNKFGTGELATAEDLQGKLYVHCVACLSIYSDFLSWANQQPVTRFVRNPKDADQIVVLGCQVTDLAVLNDFRTAEYFVDRYQKKTFLGGCVAQRFDIPFPPSVQRLGVVQQPNQPIERRDLITFGTPFWVANFQEDQQPTTQLKQGNIFRNMYPLKIGAGCAGHCRYCTIRHVRGITYEQEPTEQIAEFLAHEDVVLIADSPTVAQIKGWCLIAIRYQKQISFRNVEPLVCLACFPELKALAEHGLLKILHTPVQSADPEILVAMNRSATATIALIEKVQELRALGTLVATNLIIDYPVRGEIRPNWDEDFLKAHFDYYSWNPYWDGVWQRDKAEARFEKYLPA